MKSMKKYQYTRSIGFQLKGDAVQHLKPKVVNEEEFDFQELVNQYDVILADFKRAVFFVDEKNKKYIKKSLEIKSPWLKKHAKVQFYYKKLYEKKEKKFTIETAPFLNDIFFDWAERNEMLLEEMKKIAQKPLCKQKRKSDFAFLARKIFGSDYLFFVRDFSEYAKDTQLNEALQRLKKSVKKFTEYLEHSLYILSPQQSIGMEVARGSFNFYTINKISKLFGEKTVEDIITEKEEEGNMPYHKAVNSDFLEKMGLCEYLKNWEGEDGEKYSTTVIKDLSFWELYLVLKDFKARQKKEFNEVIYQEKWRDESITQSSQKRVTGKFCFSKIKGKKFNSLEDLAQAGGLSVSKEQKTKIHFEVQQKKKLKEYIKNTFPLFDCNEDTLWEFVKLTEKIKKKAQEKNNNNVDKDVISEDLKTLRNKRGKYFQHKFKNYSKYCKDFKFVAMDFGKLTAEIRSLEQEKIEARLLRYWAHIIDDGHQKSLLLIPREKISEAKRFIENSGEQGNYRLFSFNSLTLRALDKLIRKNYAKEISEESGHIPFQQDQEKISCYKRALKGELKELQLDSFGFEESLEEIILREYNSLEDFRIALERVSYCVHEKTVSKNFLEELQSKYQAIITELSCFDLERDISGRKRAHTICWENFWYESNMKNNFPVRLNPELRIFYRDKIEQEDVKKQKNRFSKQHFRARFTVTQDAAGKELKTTFSNEKDLCKKIEKFNAEVASNFIKYQEAEDNFWYFGIDRGNQELATLGIVKWTKEDYKAIMEEGSIQKFSKPYFPEIEVLEISDMEASKEIIINRDGTKKEVKIKDNPSYFLQNEAEIKTYFDEKKVSFIDLTTAKLIKGRIALNGDTKTYLNLKRANAKRRLFTEFTKIDKNSDVYFFEDDSSFRINFKPGERRAYQILCYYLPQQEKVLSRDVMKKELQGYLEQLRQDPTFQENTIEEINHLRDAITANMVGIIAFLHEKYPAIINLENLHSKANIQRHFNSNNENIARRLEWALYRKFQKKGLVPPNLKQTIFLRESIAANSKIHNFGIIQFVETGGTSGNCPYCGVNVSGKQRKKDKFVEHAYICRNNKMCKFTTKNPKYPLEVIDNSDSVAAYNIAKLGFEIVSAKL